MKLKVYREGDKKITHKFLFFPIVCGYDCRWLEWSYIEYRLICHAYGNTWIVNRFLTKEEYFLIKNSIKN